MTYILNRSYRQALNLLSKINFNESIMPKQTIRYLFYLVRIKLVIRHYCDAIFYMEKLLQNIHLLNLKTNLAIIIAKHCIFLKYFDEDNKLDISYLIKNIEYSKIHQYYLLLYSYISNDELLLKKTINLFKDIFISDKLYTIIINSNLSYYIKIRKFKEINKLYEGKSITIDKINFLNQNKINFIIKLIKDKHFNAKINLDENIIHIFHYEYKKLFDYNKQSINISTDTSENY